MLYFCTCIFNFFYVYIYGQLSAIKDLLLYYYYYNPPGATLAPLSIFFCDVISDVTPRLGVRPT